MKRISANTKPIIKNVKGVNNVFFHIFFPIKRNNTHKDLNFKMLKRIMRVSCNKYRHPGEIFEYMDGIYITKYNINIKRSADYVIFDFYITVPREGLIDEFSLDKALSFFYDLIFDPALDNDSFDSKVFDYERNYFLEGTKDFPININQFDYDECIKFADPNEDYDICNDTYVKLLKETSPKSVYNLYNEVITNNNYFSYIYGAIEDENKILDTFNKYFKQEEKDISFDVNFARICSIEEYKEKEITSKYNQSSLILEYKIKDYKEDERFKFDLFKWLISSPENDMILKKLRIENGLIYTYDFDYYVNRGYFFITIHLKYEDMDKVKNYMKEIINSIKDKEVFEKNKAKTIKALGYDLLDAEDGKYSEVDDDMRVRYSNNIPLKEKIEIVKNISFDDMSEFVSRVINTSTLVIKGDKDV